MSDLTAKVGDHWADENGRVAERMDVADDSLHSKWMTVGVTWRTLYDFEPVRLVRRVVTGEDLDAEINAAVARALNDTRTARIAAVTEALSTTTAWATLAVDAADAVTKESPNEQDL